MSVSTFYLFEALQQQFTFENSWIDRDEIKDSTCRLHTGINCGLKKAVLGVFFNYFCFKVSNSSGYFMSVHVPVCPQICQKCFFVESLHRWVQMCTNGAQMGLCVPAVNELQKRCNCLLENLFCSTNTFLWPGCYFGTDGNNQGLCAYLMYCIV